MDGAHSTDNSWQINRTRSGPSLPTVLPKTVNSIAAMLPKRKSFSSLACRTIYKNRRFLLTIVIGTVLGCWGLGVSFLLSTASGSIGGSTNVTMNVQNSEAQTQRREMLQASNSIYQDGAPPVKGTRVVLATPGSDRTTELVYALPTTTTERIDTSIQGVALLLHGCSHSALKFFSPTKDDSCPTCIGLAEELNIARILLQQQTLAVIAVTSQDRKRGCWSKSDMPHIQHALQHIIRKIQEQQPPKGGSRGFPILAFGASSGGRFAAQLAVRQIVDAAMVGVMSLGQELVQKWIDMGLDDNHRQKKKRPPIYLAPMPRDKRTTTGSMEDYERMILARTTDVVPRAIHDSPVRLDTTTCVPMPVTATYLNQRVPHMSFAMAEMVVDALTSSSHIDAASGMLTKDPTQSNWRDILQEQCGGSRNKNIIIQDNGCLEQQPLGPGVSPLAKALHRCWAFHEYCSEVTLKALAFFQEELGGPFFFHGP